MAANEPVAVEAVVADLDRRLMSEYTKIANGVRWYYPSTPFVLAHIRKQLKRIRRAYISLSQTTPVESDFHTWLTKRADAVKPFAESLSLVPEEVAPVVRMTKRVPKLALWATPLLGLSLVTTSFSALVLSIVDACYCYLVRIVFVSFLAGVALAVAGFFAKRELFLKSGGATEDGVGSRESADNLYGLECRLLRAVGARPRGEAQLDVFFWLIGAVFFYFYDDLAEAFQGDHVVEWRVHPSYLGFVMAAIALIALVQSFRRPWGWKAG